MQWGHGQFEDEYEWETTDEPRSLVGWLQINESGQMRHQFNFSLATSAGERILPMDAIRRVMCHVVINKLPSVALSEAWASLSEMAEFYAYEPEPTLIAGKGEQITATIVESVQRPTFVIDE